MSPHGPVSSYPTEYVASDEILSDNGAYVISRAAPGAFGLTTVVLDDRATEPPFDTPIGDADIVLESVAARGLRPPPGGHLRLSTKTDRRGSFAFVDVPARREGTCYRLTVTSSGLGTFRYFDVYFAGETYYSNVLMRAEPHDEIGTGPNVERASVLWQCVHSAATGG